MIEFELGVDNSMEGLRNRLQFWTGFYQKAETIWQMRLTVFLDGRGSKLGTGLSLVRKQL